MLRHTVSMLLCVCIALLSGCTSNKKQLDQKKLKWRIDCEQMMLKGADSLINHHDFTNRCTQHYGQYCTHRCETVLQEGGGSDYKELASHCREYLKQYMVKKCHHMCDLTPKDLQDYRAYFVQKVQDEMVVKGGCSNWDKSDNLTSKKSDPVADNLLNDDVNIYHLPSLMQNSGSAPQSDDFLGRSTTGPTGAGSPSRFINQPTGANPFADDDYEDYEAPSSSSPSDDDTSSDKHPDDLADEEYLNDMPWKKGSKSTTADDQGSDSSPAPDEMGDFLKGFKPAQTFSLSPDSTMTSSGGPSSDSFSSASAQPSRRSQSNANSPSIFSKIETVENEVVTSRNSLQAAKDIFSLFKGGAAR